MSRIVRHVVGSLVVLLAACSSAPPAPQWQSNAKAALDRAVAAHLGGDTRAANAEFELARREVARTGRADLVAMAELTRCAVRVASLDAGPCDGFETLRNDATPAERAYADYLLGRVQAGDVALLPEHHRPFAASGLSGDAATSALGAVDDPLASSPNALCRARTASSMYLSSITTEILISLVEIIWMLMPSSDSVRNIRLAMPTCERMPMPTTDTLQIFGSPTIFARADVLLDLGVQHLHRLRVLVAVDGEREVGHAVDADVLHDHVDVDVGVGDGPRIW
jgi:hypothetical protein